MKSYIKTQEPGTKIQDKNISQLKYFKKNLGSNILALVSFFIVINIYLSIISFFEIFKIKNSDDDGVLICTITF